MIMKGRRPLRADVPSSRLYLFLNSAGYLDGGSSSGQGVLRGEEMRVPYRVAVKRSEPLPVLVIPSYFWVCLSAGWGWNIELFLEAPDQLKDAPTNISRGIAGISRTASSIDN
jgi:hypothetical protein